MPERGRVLETPYPIPEAQGWASFPVTLTDPHQASDGAGGACHTFHWGVKASCTRF